MARVKIQAPEGSRVVELQALNTIGRLPTNSIQVTGVAVSKEHCTIDQRGGRFVLRDLASKNGTFINGLKVEGEQELRVGDDIMLGHNDTRMFVESLTVATKPAAAKPDVPATVFPFGSGPQAAVTQVTAVRGPMIRSLMAEDAHVELQDAPRSIGQAVPLQDPGFLPYQKLAGNEAQLSLDYERLRICNDLSKAIAQEQDTGKLLNTILDNLRRIVRAERGAILLLDEDGTLSVGASQRSDGSTGTIRVSRTIIKHAMDSRSSLLTEDAVQELLFNSSPDGAADDGNNSVMALIKNNIQSAMIVPLVHDAKVLGAIWLDSSSEAQFTRWDVDMVGGIASQASMFIHMNILARRVQQEMLTRERLSRLLSPNIAARVASGQLKVEKGGHLVQRGVVFNSDIRGFTRMSESEPPEFIVDLLNDYFERMVEVLFRYEGTLDKFMGDGLMALWGAPVFHEDGEVRAIHCALDMMDALKAFNAERGSRNHPPIKAGIGIHTGPMIAGYIGSSKTLSYTAIGDTVNTSARICGIAAEDQILVSEATAGGIHRVFNLEELPAVAVKGKEKPLRLFAVMGRK